MMWIVGESSDLRPSRGGWRGRGRGRGGIAATGSLISGRETWKAKSAFTKSPEPPLGPLLSSLSKSDFNQDAKDYESRSAISGCKVIASYNWLDKKDPTIVVPGMSMVLPSLP